MVRRIIVLAVWWILCQIAGWSDTAKPYTDHSGAVLPPIAVFDEQGDSFSLLSLFNTQPVLLLPIYTSCPHSCSAITEGWKEALETLGEPGKSLTVITFSFDHRDTPADLKRFRRRWKLPVDSWYVVSADSAAIDTLLAAIGMPVRWDDRLQIYTHPNLAVFLTAGARISSYYVGVSPDPGSIRKAITAASQNLQGISWWDRAWTQCFVYDPVTGEIQFDVSILIHLAAGIIVLSSLIFFFLRNRVRAAR